MADTNAPASTPELAPGSPASAPAPAAASAAAPAAPVAADPAPVAARDLYIRRAGRMAKLAGEGSATAVAQPPNKPAGEASAPAAEPPPNKPAQPPSDEELMTLIREDRRVKAEARRLETEARRLEAERAKLAQQVQAIGAAEQALAKNDPVAALQAIFPQVDPDELFFALLKRGAGAGGGQAQKIPTADELAELAVQRLEAKRAAEAEEAKAAQAAEEQAAQAALAEARSAYLAECNAIYHADASRYPGIGRVVKLLGDRQASQVISDRLVEITEKHWRDTKLVLPPAEALAKVSAGLWAAEPAPAASHHAPAVTTAWRSDPGRPAPQRLSLEQRREQRRLALRGQ